MPILPPAFAHLPELPGDGFTVVCEVDRYDGPISGLVRRGQELGWFDWIIDAEPSGDQAEPRAFSLHLLPAALVAAAEAWMQRHQAFSREFGLVANQHLYPMNARQRAALRSEDAITAEWTAHSEARPRWEELPATGWFLECGQEFAAIRTFHLSAADAEAFARWQREVARSLQAEDQPALDRLFASRVDPSDPGEIYYVTQPGGAQPHAVRPWGSDQEVPCIVRDWRGQPLPDDHVMTSEHRVQCFDGLLADQPAS